INSKPNRRMPTEMDWFAIMAVPIRTRSSSKLTQSAQFSPKTVEQGRGLCKKDPPRLTETQQQAWFGSSQLLMVSIFSSHFGNFHYSAIFPNCLFFQESVA